MTTKARLGKLEKAGSKKHKNHNQVTELVIYDAETGRELARWATGAAYWQPDPGGEQVTAYLPDNKRGEP